MKKKTIVVAVVVIAVIVVAVKLLQSRKAEIADAPLPSAGTVTVTVVKVKQGSLKNKVPFLAQVLSDKSIKLSTKLAGYVEKVLVEEAQKVKKGEVLVRIDALELTSGIEALNATLRAQKNDFVISKQIYDRNKKLYRIGGLSKEKLDIALGTLKMKRAVVENTQQKLAQQQHQLSYLQIVAPFDGEIDSILMHEGDLAATGKPILSMSNAKKKLRFSYAPAKSNFIKKEQNVFMDDMQVGYVKSIYTTSQNGLTSAEVTLTEKIDLPTGSSANITVLVKEVKGCMVPSDTVLHKKDNTYVMAYEKGQFSAMKIKIKMQEAHEVVIFPCPSVPIAKASEVKLAQLPAYDQVTVVEAGK